jgi:GTP cyclohydrolase IA
MNQKVAEKHLHSLLTAGLGLDLTDPNLVDTPKRMAKMFCQEFFVNIDKEFTDFKAFPNSRGYDQIVMFDHINFTSMCSHHFLPFTGLGWLLYIPHYTLIGASKAARLIDHYARRPQLQENLAHQVASKFHDNIKPKGVMVVLQAVHGCMSCRGVKQYAGAGMGTSVIMGCFKEEAIRNEALQMIAISMKIKEG